MAFLFDPSFQRVSALGLPLSGATLTFYRAGTSTKITVYQDSAATTPHTNPVVADSSGAFPAIFLTTTSPYKFILKSALGVTIDTVDHIPVGDVFAFVSSRTDLKALKTTATTLAYLTEEGREGQFIWRTGDYSAQIAADVAEGVYIKADDTAATSGAWVRAGATSGDLLNVRWFGAVGDGSTDDASAIQAGIDFASTLGGVLLFPEAVFAITSLTLKSDVELRGISESAELRRTTNSATSLIQGTNINNAAVVGLTIDANQAGTSDGLDCITFNDGCYNMRVVGNTIKNAERYGVHIVDGADGTQDTYSIIQDNVIDTTLLHGIFIHNSSRIEISANTVRKTYGYGILANGTVADTHKDLIINSNRVIETVAMGIFVERATGGTAADAVYRNVQMNNNTVEGCAAGALGIQARGGSVVGNTILNCGSYSYNQGILVNGWGITVSGNKIDLVSGVGIDFGDCYRIICVGNYIERCGIMGIEINSCVDFIVSDNLLLDNNTTAEAGSLAAGILVHLGTGGYPFVGDCENGVIANNIVRSGTEQLYGIYVTADSSNIRVIGNDCVGAGSSTDILIQTPTGGWMEADNQFDAPTIASASSITLPSAGTSFVISGTTNIATIAPAGGTYPTTKTIVLRFTGALTLQDSVGNLFLAGDFTTASGATITLHAVTGGWIELSRVQT